MAYKLQATSNWLPLTRYTYQLQACGSLGGGSASDKLQTTRYKLQVTGYILQVAPMAASEGAAQATSCKLQVTGYRLQVTGYRLQLQITSYKLYARHPRRWQYTLQATTSYNLQATTCTRGSLGRGSTSCKLQATSCQLHAMSYKL